MRKVEFVVFRLYNRIINRGIRAVKPGNNVAVGFLQLFPIDYDRNLRQSRRILRIRGSGRSGGGCGYCGVGDGTVAFRAFPVRFYNTYQLVNGKQKYGRQQKR